MITSSKYPDRNHQHPPSITSRMGGSWHASIHAREETLHKCQDSHIRMNHDDKFEILFTMGRNSKEMGRRPTVLLKNILYSGKFSKLATTYFLNRKFNCITLCKLIYFNYPPNSLNISQSLDPLIWIWPSPTHHHYQWI